MDPVLRTLVGKICFQEFNKVAAIVIKSRPSEEKSQTLNAVFALNRAAPATTVLDVAAVRRYLVIREADHKASSVHE